MERHIRIARAIVQAAQQASGSDISPLPFIATGLIATLIGAVLLFDIKGIATSLKNSTPATKSTQTPSMQQLQAAVLKAVGGIALVLGTVSLVAGIAILIRRG